MDLSKNQQRVLNVLGNREMSAKEIFEELDKNYTDLPKIWWTQSKVYSILRRLGNRKIVTHRIVFGEGGRGLPNRYRMTVAAYRAWQEQYAVK